MKYAPTFDFIKQKKMKQLLFVLSVLFIIISCDSDVLEEDVTTGTGILAINDKIVLIDTMTLQLSTINFDSLQTSSSSRLLIGGYTDPLMGRVRAESYFEFSPSSLKLGSSDSDTYTPNYVFDSIVMILRHDRYFYGDTTQIQQLYVHKLTQKVKQSGENATAFYNSATLNYDTNPVGIKTFFPRPTENDSLVIRLNDSYGLDVFQKLKNFEFGDINQFHDYFKGIVVRNGATVSPEAVCGYTTNSVIRLYYSINDDSDENDGLYKDFSITDLGKQFNSITLNRSGTVLQNLPASTSYLNSSLSNNAAFIQSGTGLACRVDFPHLKSLYSIDHKGIIVDAKLILKPVRTSHNKRFALRDSLRLYEADHLNRIQTKLTTATGEDLLGILNDSSNEFGDNVYYSFSIGTFLNKELQKEGNNPSSLILTLPDYQKTVNRIVLGGQNNNEDRVQLKIYYLPYP